MIKCIKIEGCDQCPSQDHQGGFGQVQYIPCCSRKNRKKLPYKEVANGRGGVTAQGSNVIPKWCPLDDLPEDQESTIAELRIKLEEANQTIEDLEF